MQPNTCRASERHISEARTQLSRIVAAPDEQIDLARAALWIAAEEYPNLDIEAYIAQINAMADDVGARVTPGHTPAERLSLVTTYLHEERGLRGNVATYYDARNSFLNDVLDRRLGIPISLSIIYISVAQRIGVPLSGVSFPGHFLLRHDADETHFIDPFNPANLMSRNDCERLLAWMTSGRVAFEPGLLHKATPHDILARLLTNLKTLYLRAGDSQRALAAVDRILMLRPEAADEYRDRAVIYMQLEAFRLALDDLEQFLPLTEDEDERHVFAIVAQRLRKHIAALN